MMILGDFPLLENFHVGRGSQAYILYPLFCLCTFILTIHLLNMLVAIMSNTFNARQKVGSQISTRDHLKFIVDNWYLKDNVFEN